MLFVGSVDGFNDGLILPVGETDEIELGASDKDGDLLSSMVGRSLNVGSCEGSKLGC